MWTQSSFQAAVKGSQAGMWGNVLARQPVASGTVQYTQQPPNLILEPETGSIYMQKKKKTERERVTESSSEQDL